METELIPAVTEATRAFFTTSFEEYTVTEGFLLLFLLAGFIWLCVRFFKGGI